METAKAQFHEAINKLEEAMGVISYLTEKITEEIGGEQSIRLFRSKEELFARLFPDGLPLEKLDKLRKITSAARDKRRHRRVSLIHAVEYEVKGERFSRYLTDISVGGLFIDTPNPLPLGTITNVRFSLPDSEQPIVTTAEVRYVQEKIGMGIKFLNLGPEDKEKILRFLNRVYSQRWSMIAQPNRISRVMVKIPITLKGTERDGTRFEDKTDIITLSKNGACVLSSRNLDVGMTISLHTSKGSEFEASIVWVGNESFKTKGQIGIQCRGLAQAFGFNFPI